MNICQVGAELFHVDGQTDGQAEWQVGKHDITNSRFSQFSEST
jgi:hypothetical protein